MNKLKGLYNVFWNNGKIAEGWREGVGGNVKREDNSINEEKVVKGLKEIKSRKSA